MKLDKLDEFMCFVFLFVNIFVMVMVESKYLIKRKIFN